MTGSSIGLSHPLFGLTPRMTILCLLTWMTTMTGAGTASANDAVEHASVAGTPDRYEIGEPVLTDLYVSPTGNDAQSGRDPARPLKTFGAAWNKVPRNTSQRATGYRIHLMRGTYSCEPAEPDDCRNFFADRHGTYRYPIILSADEGRGSVTIRGGLNILDVDYLYLVDLTLVGGGHLPTNASGNNLLHLADANHVLLRRLTLKGPDCPNDSCNNLQEVLKVNQARHLYVEDSRIGGAWHTAVDYFVVQHGHFLRNRLHTAGQWCMYVKGGSAYLRIDGNTLEHCQLGFQAGQSANLAMMRTPWVHYDAYDIKFVNNVLRHLPGVGLSVAGGYNVLFAYNTLYDVGTSGDPGYPLIQATFAERGCNPTDELQEPVPVCKGLAAEGGWGPVILTENQAAIPNRNVYIYNNLIYNPTPDQTLYTHLDVARWISLPAGFKNLPKRPKSDQNLVIAGNVIWNGPVNHPLGVDETTGCAPSNPTCNATQLRRDNQINTLEPELVDAAGGDLHPLASGNLFGVTALPIPRFEWSRFEPSVPAGTLPNRVPYDHDGRKRGASAPPGAFATGSDTGS